MPSIRVYAIPGVAKELTYPMEIRLFQALRLKVATNLGLEVKDTEVLWIPVQMSDNAEPLAIEVMYSVRPGLNPDEATRKALAEEIVNTVIAFDWLPKSVTEVTAWILPQHEAVFRIARRQAP